LEIEDRLNPPASIKKFFSFEPLANFPCGKDLLLSARRIVKLNSNCFYAEQFFEMNSEKHPDDLGFQPVRFTAGFRNHGDFGRWHCESLPRLDFQ
jgi:hypothetical protein